LLLAIAVVHDLGPHGRMWPSIKMYGAVHV